MSPLAVFFFYPPEALGIRPGGVRRLAALGVAALGVAGIRH